MQFSIDDHFGVSPRISIEQSFWAAVGDPIWKNVATDMKEALDRRDGNQMDPAFNAAARALESTIKIISDRKGWTHGREKGTHGYIDNLASATNGRFIDWQESEALKGLFTESQNPVGHGAGIRDFPECPPQLKKLAVERFMSWITDLIQRI